MKISRLLIGLVLLLAAALAALFFLLFERYTEKADRGWSAAAWRNPYLAAEQFLAAAGVRHRRADNISELARLAPDDTLFLASSTQVYNPRRASELLEWVARGGHAIVIAHALDSTERDWLLEELGVTLEEGREKFFMEHPFRDLLGEDVEKYEGKTASEILREHNRKLKDGKRDTEADGEEETQEEQAPRNPEVDPEDLVELTGDNGSYQLHFNPSQLLHHPALEDETVVDGPVFWAKIRRGDSGVPFMQFQRGDGRITLLTDGGIWQNRRIGHFDHAYFLALLASSGEFIFLTQPHFESLFVLARRYAGEFFLAGGLALLAWLLLRSRRFGPLAVEPERARRSLLEHISACGHYYWRADRCERLLDEHRRALLRRLGAEGAGQATRRQVCERLSAETGLDETTIAACLWGDPPRSEEAFTERMRNLQQIEAVL
ncbi:DUF4350 domain-containing protein [Microbulbifer thermotolerans]|uniref:DUF4350 domain-containing protein n=1 Tax=Microbulbifer thermotolerans TaxID=252514 RepID=UPI00224A8CCE|nr:DUF4350 domain-containing protein [Microbulbifer thermotolerans]MCX2783593.1 DUF4350 domain-containing protein [Microbulbifer thermotolerans]MCX2842050.1 DUF4350 domain-containing protein [Microbulbifer thermotolerans]